MQRKKRKCTESPRVSEDTQNKQTRTNIYNELKRQKVMLETRESKVLVKWDLESTIWNNFLSFCSRYMYYMRYLHADFHYCLELSLKENNIAMKERKNSKGESRLRQTNFSHNNDESLWVHIFIFEDGTKDFVIYKMLITEFSLVMQSMFLSNCAWMNTLSPESTIPTVILRGGLRFFPKKIQEWFPKMNPFSFKLNPFFHESVDIFRLVREYGNPESNVLAKEILDAHNRQYEEEEDDAETDPDNNNSDLQEIASQMPSETSLSVLSSLSSLYSPSTLDEDGNPRTRTESEKLYSRYFYMKLPFERVSYSNKRPTSVHPYDLGLYAFVEAKKFGVSNGKSICENYKMAIDCIKNMDQTTHNDIFEMLNDLKNYIFGKGDENFNLAHVIMAENIASLASHSDRVTRLKYSIKERANDSILIQFDRKDIRVLDVLFAFEYLNIKYKKIFRVNVSEGITWDDHFTYFKLPIGQYTVLVETIVFLESFKYRPPNPVPLYPIISQRFLHGGLIEREQAVNVILKSIRDTRIRSSPFNRWISLNGRDDIDYLMLLPKIIARYGTFQRLWDSLTMPYRTDLLHQNYGPSERWINKQCETEEAAYKYLEKEKHGKLNKVSYYLTGFNGDAANIYIGLESFFAIRSRHMMNYWALKQVYDEVQFTDWFDRDYSSLSKTLESIIAGDWIKNIHMYGDEDLIDLPFGINLEQEFAKMSEDHTIWDYVHVQLIKLCADERMSPNIAILLFESMPMRNHRLGDGNTKKIQPSNNYHLLEQMTTVKDLVSEHLKKEGMHQPFYGFDFDNLENDSPDPIPDDFFIFLMESLERLSFFHTSKGPERPKEVNLQYRGYQRKAPEPSERWLPFKNSLIHDKENRLDRLPVYYEQDSTPVFSNHFIPTMWTLSIRFSGCQSLIRGKLKNYPKICSFMLSDPDLLNCLLCYPISSL